MFIKTTKISENRNSESHLRNDTSIMETGNYTWTARRVFAVVYTPGAGRNTRLMRKERPCCADEAYLCIIHSVGDGRFLQ